MPGAAWALHRTVLPSQDEDDGLNLSGSEEDSGDEAGGDSSDAYDSEHEEADADDDDDDGEDETVPEDVEEEEFDEPSPPKRKAKPKRKPERAVAQTPAEQPSRDEKAKRAQVSPVFDATPRVAAEAKAQTKRFGEQSLPTDMDRATRFAAWACDAY